MARHESRAPTWTGRKNWRLTDDEKQVLAKAVAEAPVPHSLTHQRAFLNPAPDLLPLERRQAAMLSAYASSMDDNLTAALQQFMPDDLWRLLRSLEAALRGAPRKRDLRESVAELVEQADVAVGCWRDVRRVRERVLNMAAKGGLRGWDPPDKRTYRNSAPVESHHYDAITSTETMLLAHAAWNASRWLAQRTLLADLEKPKHVVAWRREIVTLLASGGLGYERIATLATAKIWKNPPCPTLKRSALVKVLKADLRPGRRRSPTRSAAVV